MKVYAAYDIDEFWYRRRLIRICVNDADELLAEFQGEDFPFNWGM